MVPPPRKLSRMNAELWSRVTDLDRSTDTVAISPGLDVRGGPQGNVLIANDPAKMVPVFVVGFLPDEIILVREAHITTPGVVWINHDQTALIDVRAFPGFTTQHFLYDVIGPDDLNEFTPPDYQPQPKDRAAMMIGGYVMPIRRILLVAPAAVADLCVPCIPPPPTPIPPTGATHDA